MPPGGTPEELQPEGLPSEEVPPDEVPPDEVPPGAWCGAVPVPSGAGMPPSRPPRPADQARSASGPPGLASPSLARAEALRTSPPRVPGAPSPVERASQPEMHGLQAAGSWFFLQPGVVSSPWVGPRAKCAPLHAARTPTPHAGARPRTRGPVSAWAGAGFPLSAAGQNSVLPRGRRVRRALLRSPRAGAQPGRRWVGSPRARDSALARPRDARSTWPRRGKVRRRGAPELRCPDHGRPWRPASWTLCWQAAWPLARWDRSLWATFSPVRRGPALVLGKHLRDRAGEPHRPPRIPRLRCRCPESGAMRRVLALRCCGTRLCPGAAGGILHCLRTKPRQFSIAACSRARGGVGVDKARQRVRWRSEREAAAAGRSSVGCRCRRATGAGAGPGVAVRGAPRRALQRAMEAVHSTTHPGAAGSRVGAGCRAPQRARMPEGSTWRWTGAPRADGLAAPEARCNREGRRSALARLPPEVFGGEPGSRRPGRTARHVPGGDREPAPLARIVVAL